MPTTNAAGRPDRLHRDRRSRRQGPASRCVRRADQGPLALTGPLTLDGAGDPNSVFIFQTRLDADHRLEQHRER